MSALILPLIGKCKELKSRFEQENKILKEEDINESLLSSINGYLELIGKNIYKMI